MNQGSGERVDIWTRLPVALEETLQSLHWAAGAGFSAVVAVGQSTRRREQLREGVRALDLDLTLFFRDELDLTDVGPSCRERTWGDGMLFGTVPSSRDLKRTARILGELGRSGVVPVVVAPELNPEVRRQPELLRYILGTGAGCCAMAGSFVGHNGRGARLTASRIAWLGYYSFVGGFTAARAGPRAVARGARRPSYTWRRTQGDWLDKSMARARALVQDLSGE